MSLMIFDPRCGHRFDVCGISRAQRDLIVVDASGFDWEPHAGLLDVVARESADDVHCVGAPWRKLRGPDRVKWCTSHTTSLRFDLTSAPFSGD